MKAYKLHQDLVSKMLDESIFIPSFAVSFLSQASSHVFPTIPICYFSMNSDSPSVSHIQAAAEEVAEDAEEEEDSGSPFTPPDSWKGYPMWIISLPWYFAFTYTIPPCSSERWAKYYILSFVMSIAWIGAISWFMVEWAAAVGCILHVPNVVMV